MSSTAPKFSELSYLNGFGNLLQSEALPGTLPERHGAPQKPAHGLFMEYVSGTTFLAPRESNKYLRLYRIRPTVDQGAFRRIDNNPLLLTGPFEGSLDPNFFRWKPLSIPTKPTDFVDGLATIGGNGSSASQAGMAIHIYRANCSMQDRAFVNGDGDFLVVPQQGRLHVITELGLLEVRPKEMLLLPRGLRFSVLCPDGPSRGFVCENYGLPFRLPELGPIGSHGLANPGDFQAPTAWYENTGSRYELVQKYGGNLWAVELKYSPFNVVGWRGTHVPLKYDMTKFVTLGSVSVDHPDPSIYTALTSPSNAIGGSNIDFVIFAPRWTVSEDTFRPPAYHRNVMSEFLGLVHGEHYSRSDGFQPGACFMQNAWVPHGPDPETFEMASNAKLEPQPPVDHLSFMFETRYPIQLTRFAQEAPELLTDRQQWDGFKTNFRK
jgi:homogentisate 1,2-dioxygenase